MNEKFRKLLLKLNIDPKDFTLRSMLVVLGVFAVGFFVLGIGNMAISQFTNPMAEEFGVARSVITLYSTFSKIAGCIASIAFAFVYKKVGPKGLVLVASGTLMIEFVCFALATSPIWVYVGAFIGGFGAQFAGSLMIFTIIKPWFQNNLGIFTAICGTASGLGGSLFTKRIAAKIAADGFRSGAWFVVILMAIFVIIPVLLVKAAPNDPLYSGRLFEKSDKAESDSGKKKATKIPALGWLDYLKCPATWLLVGIMFIAAGTNHPFVQALNGVAEWKGFDGAVVGAAAIAAYSFWLAWAKFGMGIVRDTLGMKVVVWLAWGTNLICVAGMLFIPNLTSGMFVFLAALNSLAGTSTGLLNSYAVVQAFGKYYNARVHGIVVAAFNIGRAIGAPLVQVPYDVTGSYAPLLWIMLVVGVLMIVMNLAAFKTGAATQARLDKMYAERGIDTNV